MKDSELIDQFKAKFDIENDSEVATFLKMDKGSISNVRSEKRNLSTLQKLKLLDKIGYAWAEEAVLYFLAEEKKENLKKKRSDKLKSRINNQG